jgi:hypothetical protein
MAAIIQESTHRARTLLNPLTDPVIRLPKYDAATIRELDEINSRFDQVEKDENELMKKIEGPDFAYVSDLKEVKRISFALGNILNDVSAYSNRVLGIFYDTINQQNLRLIRWTGISYLLYTLGVGITLIGKLYGTAGMEMD